MAESTLRFEHSQRESSASILACAIDKSTGNFITYDDSATRLWSLKKMIKSTRIEKAPEHVFLDLVCMEKIAKVLVVFTLKHSSEEKGGIIHILSLSLAHMQTVDLNYHAISRFSMSPSQTEVVIIDKYRTVFAVHVETLISDNQENDQTKPKSAGEQYHNSRKHKLPRMLKLHGVQSIDLRKSNILDVLMVNDNTIAILGTKTIRLYSRPQLIYVPPIVDITPGVAGGDAPPKPAKKKWMSKKEKAAAAAAALLAEQEAEQTPDVSAAASVASAEPVKKYNEFTPSGKLNIFQGASRSRAPKDPTILRLLSKDKLIIGFDDGSAQILYSPALLDPATTRTLKPALQISLGDGHRGEGESKSTELAPAQGTLGAVLCEFQAHFVAERGYRPDTSTERTQTPAAVSTEGAGDDLSEPDLNTTEKPVKQSPFGLRTAVICPWGNCSGGPGLGYQMEILTVGSDRRLAHWGVRFKPGQSDVILVPHYSSATRATTARTSVGGEDNEEEEPLGFEDSLEEGTTYSRPGTRQPSDVPMEADLLGEYQLPLEPPTTVNAVSKQAPKFLALAFELSLLRNPICKKVLCIVDGMLMFFDALQPHRIVVGRKDPELEKSALGVGLGTVTKVVRATRNDVSTLEMGGLIVGSAKGPMLAQVLNRMDGGFRDAASVGVEENPLMPQSTVIVLREHSIELVLVQTGQLLQYFSTAHLHEAVLAEAGPAALMETGSPTKKGMGRQGHAMLATSIVRNSSISNRQVRAAEGKPSAVYWCPITHLILVGYTTGGVGMLAPTGLVHSTFARPPLVHLQSGTQHGAEITQMITFHHRIQYKSAAPGGPPPPRDVVVALVGDGNGVISLWQLFPAMMGKASPLISTTQAHSGKIVYAHSCLMDENSINRIIITACANGMMKAWKLEGSGALTLTAFFQVDLNGARLTAAVAIPTAHYQVQEKPDDSVSIVSAMSVVSAAATNLVASLHHEIFCIVGLSNGIVESWLLTDDRQRSRGTALASFQDNHAPITQIIRHPNKSSLQVSLRNHSESVFSLPEPNSPFVCMSADGSCTVVKVNEAGLFRRTSYFSLPGPINSAVCLFSPPVSVAEASFRPPPAVGGMPKTDSLISTAFSSDSTAIPPPAASELNLSPPVIECVAFSDFKVYHVLPVTASHIPPLWFKSFRQSALVHHQRNQLPLGASKYFSQTLNLIASPTRGRSRSPGARRSVSPLGIGQASLQDSLQGSSFGVLGGPQQLQNSDLAISPNANITALMNYDRDGSTQQRGPFEQQNEAEQQEAIALQQLAVEAVSAGLRAEESMSTLQSQSVTDDRRHYVGPMESMQRIVSAELHFAKKDSRLLDLFAKHEPSADATVNPETAVEIVFAWLDQQKVAKENIWELFRLLEIQSTDRLRFVEVAKIAAVVMSALHRSAAQKPVTRGVSYANMRSYTTKVTYNAMGEKSIERIPFSKGTHEGIFKGFASTIRKVWKQQPPRVITQAEVASQAPKAMPAILSALPKPFDKLLPKNTEVPKVWGPDNTHWFHPLRVIRIVRTLLDIRSAKQHEVFLSSSLFKSSSADVTPLSDIVVRYFERNFGEAGNLLNLARHKIVHFLEACCQYKHHPIVNILQSMLQLDPAGPDPHPLAAETAIWLCVEARSTLCARGCVVSGELIQPFADDFGTTKDGAALQVRWQYAPKADVLLITDELLRERGKFGPAMYEEIQALVEAIPTLDSYVSADGQVHKTDVTAPMVDLERYLELLYHEYLRCDKQNRQYEVEVFGETSMSSAVSAQSRDIVKGKRKLVMDDHISAFGPYHEINLGKIRSWLLEFEPFDPLRSGMVTQDVLAKSVQHRAEAIDFLGPNNTPADIHRFVSFCKHRFVMNDPDGRVSYIDLFALLCAWEWQTQGNEEFLLSTLNKTLPGIHRTIETSFAENLVKYFSSMSATPDADPIWTMGPAPEDTGNPYATQARTKSTLSLARDGFWNVQSNAPQDAPGALTVQKEPVHTTGQVQVLAAQVAVKREKTKLSTDALPVAPQVLPTGRVRTSVFGETIQPIRNLTVAPISVQNLDPVDLRALDQDVRDRELALSRTSYSRSVEHMSSLTFTPSMSQLGDGSLEADSYIMEHQSPADLLLAPRPKTPEEIRSTIDPRDASNFADIEEMASQFMSLDASSQLEPGGLKEDSLTMSQSFGGSHQYPPNLLGSFTGSNFESLDPTAVKRSLAEEEARRLRREQRDRERELEILQRAEREEMKKRREEKLAMREKIRQEMRRKEREGMAYYHAALELKFQHNEKVREKMNAIAAAEEADKHKREEEILRIQQENMAKSLQKVANKNAAADAEAQHKREVHENKLMRKEDEAMRKISKALDRELKKAREEQARLAKEEKDREAAEMLAQFAGTVSAPTEGEAAAGEAVVGMPEEDADHAAADEHEGDAEDHGDDDEHGDDDDHDHDHDGDEEDEEGGDDDGEHTGEVEEEPTQISEEPASETGGVAAPESQELTDAERERLEQLAEEEMRRQQSAGQKRIQEFLDKVKEGARRHATHPRRMPRHFFIPMMFSEDIYFDPFETLNFKEDVEAAEETAAQSSQQPVEEAEEMESSKPVDPFADVNIKLGDFRKEEERKRKLLFATTLQEVPANDWIRVFRTYTVDWDSFFASQDAMVELSAAVKDSDNAIDEYFNNNDPLKKITDTLSVAPTSPALSRAGSHISFASSTGYLSGTATPDEDAAPVVTLLPYGTILEGQKVKQGDYKYYRLEQFQQNAMLTVEIQCLKGLVDVYLAYQKLPSMSMHDRHVACTKANKGIVRLAFRPHKSGTFFVSVRSHETDAKFNIWTYSSTGTADQSPIIARVSSIIRKFEILATIPEDQLQEFYPKFEREALKQVHEEEAEKARQDAENRLRAPPKPPQPVDDDASLNELYDIESVRSFIMRVSKYTLTGEESAALYGGSQLEGDFDDDLDQEYGQEIQDVFTPLMSAAPSASNLFQQPSTHAEGPGKNGGELPPLGRGYSLPALHQVKSDITMDSALLAEEGQNSFRLPSIKGAADTSAVSSSFSTVRSVPRSKSSINVAREYAALDQALAKALAHKPEKKARVENPLLHQTLKPVKYELRGKYPI